MIVSVGEKLKVINSIVVSETFGRRIEFDTPKNREILNPYIR